MIAANEQITPGQLMILIIQAQIGVSILYLPSKVEYIAENNAWMSVILAGIISALLILIMWGLSRRFPTMNFFEYLPKLVGKVMGKMIQLIFVAMFILESCQILVLFADVVRDWIFATTPTGVIIFLVLATSLYMVRENIRLIARFFVLTFGLIFVLLFIALYAYRDADMMYILPFSQTGITSVLKGTLQSLNSFYGFEILFFCYPYVQGGDKPILRASQYANIFSTVIYTFMVFTCLIVFSPEELHIIPQPVLYMIKALSFTIFERADLYFLTIWTVVVFSTVMAYLYMSAKSVSMLFGKKSHTGTSPYVALVILCISLIPHDQDMINTLQYIVIALTSITLTVLPIILLCISYVLKIKGKEQAEG